MEKRNYSLTKGGGSITSETERKAFSDYANKLEKENKKLKESSEYKKYLEQKEANLTGELAEEKDKEIEKIRDKITIRHRTEPQIVFELDTPIKYDIFFPVRFATKYKGEKKVMKAIIVGGMFFFDISFLLTLVDKHLLGNVSPFDYPSITSDITGTIFMIFLILFHAFLLVWLQKERKNKAKAKLEVNKTEKEYNK